MIRFRLLFLFAVTALLFSGCEKLKKLTEFDIYDEYIFTVPGGVTLLSPITIATPEAQLNYEAFYQNHDTRRDKIKEFYIRSISLTTVDPAGESLNFLKSVKVYLKADGLDEILVAYAEDIPNSVGAYLQLTTPQINLAEYAKKSSIDVRNEVVVDENILYDIDIKVNQHYFVKGKII